MMFFTIDLRYYSCVMSCCIPYELEVQVRTGGSPSRRIFLPLHASPRPRYPQSPEHYPVRSLLFGTLNGRGIAVIGDERFHLIADGHLVHFRLVVHTHPPGFSGVISD